MLLGGRLGAVAVHLSRVLIIILVILLHTVRVKLLEVELAQLGGFLALGFMGLLVMVQGGYPRRGSGLL